MNAFSRRHFMRIAGTGLVASWFADVVDPRLLFADTSSASPQLRNTARSCIFIFLSGAPSPLGPEGRRVDAVRFRTHELR
jgi:hypothetical protein